MISALTESIDCRIGFNSVYHITDLPSFASGANLILFDPHTDILNVSANNPGLKTDFVATHMWERMPEQCTPYQAFGCTMKEHFRGTLFRLPLRTADMAVKSRLSQQVNYSFRP